MNKDREILSAIKDNIVKVILGKDEIIDLLPGKQIRIRI